jgi:biopolymer transport protein TolR
MGMQVGGGKGDDLNSEINVTPFVDVMLVLLVIFMITAPMMTTGVDISLPQVNTQQVDSAQDKLILSIDRNRRLTLQQTAIPWAQLDEKLAANELVKSKNELYVEADQSLPYGVVVTAMAIAKNAGVGKVMLLTDSTDNIDVTELDRLVGSDPGSATGTGGQ